MKMKTVNVIYMAIGEDGMEGETCMNIRIEEKKAKLIVEQEGRSMYDRSVSALMVMDDIRKLIRYAEKLKGRRVDSMDAQFIKGVELVEGNDENLLL